MRLRFEKKFSVKEKSKYEYEPTGERERLNIREDRYLKGRGKDQMVVVMVTTA